ncbi:MAG: hypothetical protein LW689_04380 [Novosphingobium sp.]|jgi:hypothetical protein|nr:hypothetical protein [Novosphingobium sp.]MCE2842021.1 hypothetical protein [Novosphingobium sp.]
MTEQRTLTDEDVAAIVSKLEERIAQKFYVDLGKGLWGAVWRGLFAIALILAAYGAAKGVPQ